jgi:xanthine dehydrogenase YagS FAD-binding subunit
VFGYSERCVATHPSDMAVALAALEARVHVTGPAGSRTVPIPGLHRLPGEEPERDTVLEQGELITAVSLPPPPAGASKYRKVRARASYAFALVSIAAVLDVADGTVRDCRIALGGVAHAPWRARLAEEELRGARADGEGFTRAADAELAQARPLPRNAYKVPLARNLIIRTLQELVP